MMTKWVRQQESYKIQELKFQTAVSAVDGPEPGQKDLMDTLQVAWS